MVRTLFSPCASCGSIPAHAGEPLTGWPLIRQFRVYPRACGGTRQQVFHERAVPGLFPRMRGNRFRHARPAVHFGSIPAHAGEPPRPPLRRVHSRVYPRACGGTTSAGCPVKSAAGSIPAHAGEPATCRTPRPWRWVYPRACGGTFQTCGLIAIPAGLSPRMRGNLHHDHADRQHCGSIPAHAGEPRWRRLPAMQGMGLSPRMRGNQCRLSFLI